MPCSISEGILDKSKVETTSWCLDPSWSWIVTLSPLYPLKNKNQVRLPLTFDLKSSCLLNILWQIGSSKNPCSSPDVALGAPWLVPVLCQHGCWTGDSVHTSASESTRTFSGQAADGWTFWAVKPIWLHLKLGVYSKMSILIGRIINQWILGTLFSDKLK